MVAGSLNLVTMPLKMITVKCRCGLLSLFIYIFRMTWGTDSGFTMRSLLDFDPNIKSSGSFYVGSYVLQLVVHLSLQMAAHISDFAAAPVGCMKACHIAGLRSSLILIFARLVRISTIGIFEFVTSTPMTLLVASVAFHVHMSVPDVSQFINLMLAVPAEGNEKALACIVSEWAEQQVEIQGTSQIKVNTTAFSFTALHQTHSTELLWETSRRQMVSRRWKKAEDNWRLRKKFARFSVEELELMRSKHEYEDNSSEEANLDKDFDKVKMILQGLEYEKDICNLSHNKARYWTASSSQRPKNFRRMRGRHGQLKSTEEEPKVSHMLTGQEAERQNLTIRHSFHFSRCSSTEHFISPWWSLVCS